MFLDVSHITQPAVAETSSSKASVREHVRYQQAAPGYILAMLCRVLYERPTERERELRKEGREVPSRVRLREGPIGVRITLGQPTIG